MLPFPPRNATPDNTHALGANPRAIARVGNRRRTWNASRRPREQFLVNTGFFLNDVKWLSLLTLQSATPVSPTDFRLRISACRK